MSDVPARETERLADLGVARMLAALAGLHAVTGGVAAAVLDRTPALVVGGGDAVSALVLLGVAALALRLGAGARQAAPGAAAGSTSRSSSPRSS